MLCAALGRSSHTGGWAAMPAPQREHKPLCCPGTSPGWALSGEPATECPSRAFGFWVQNWGRQLRCLQTEDAKRCPIRAEGIPGLYTGTGAHGVPRAGKPGCQSQGDVLVRPSPSTLREGAPSNTNCKAAAKPNGDDPPKPARLTLTSTSLVYAFPCWGLKGLPVNKHISSLNIRMPFLLWINPSGAGASFGFVRILITDRVCLSNSLSAVDLTDSFSVAVKQQIHCSFADKGSCSEHLVLFFFWDRKIPLLHVSKETCSPLSRIAHSHWRC